MADVKSFLRRFSDTHGLTLAELASSLGYSSKTALGRLMDGGARQSTLMELNRRLENTYSLSAAETQELRTAINASLYGTETAEIWSEIRRMLRAEQPWNLSASPIRLRHVASGGREELFSERYALARDLTITLVGCTNAPVYPELAALLKRPDVRLNHYVSMCGSVRRAVYTTHVLGYMLRSNHYFPYTWREPELMGTDSSAWRGSMVCEYERDGAHWEDLLFFQPNGATIMSSRDTSGIYLQLLGVDPAQARPLRKSLSPECGMAALADYAAEYTAIEHGTATVMLKPDISTNLIPVEYLVAALPDMQLTDMHPLITVYRARYEDLRRKHKHTTVILKQGAMRSFACCGTTMDHFYRMRPFTPVEREAILASLLRMMEDSPYFHLLFLRRDDAVVDMDFTCYQGRCMLLLPPDHHYNPEAGLAELRLEMPAMQRQLELFLREELIRWNCLSETESRAYVRRLMQISREAEA